MPGSVIQGKAEIKNWIYGKPDILSIVDVGAGSATYPRLLGPQYKYIGIEIWEPYIEQFNLNQYYSRIINEDVQTVDFPDADCIIFGDVLEHLPKEAAESTLFRALSKFKHVVVSIPVSENADEVRYAKEHFGNKYENHIAGWTYDEFLNLHPWEMTVLCGKNQIGIYAT